MSILQKRKLHIQAKLEEIRRLEVEIILEAIVNPECLQGDTSREKVISLAISHLDEKRKRTTSKMPGNYARASAIQMQMAIEALEEACEKQKATYAAGMVARILKMSDAELMSIPEELKDKAFEIASMCITEVL